MRKEDTQQYSKCITNLQGISKTKPDKNANSLKTLYLQRFKLDENVCFVPPYAGNKWIKKYKTSLLELKKRGISYKS